MRILITGAAGTLGRALVAAARHRGDTVWPWTRADGDLTNPQTWVRIADLRPEALLHTAAFTDVDGAEAHPAVVAAINAEAVRHAASLAAAQAIPLVHYSTNFVFDGTQTRPYVETDLPHPRGIYAQTKLIGEWYAATAPQHYILRIASTFDVTRTTGTIGGMLMRLRQGQPIDAYIDAGVTPSSVQDVVGATYHLLDTHAAFGLYHCAQTGSPTWYALAQTLAQYVGADAALVRPIPFAAHATQRRAPRPQWAFLNVQKIQDTGYTPQPWASALGALVQR